jgi:hypothetical protein
MVEQAEAVIARHRHGKHISTAVDDDGTVEDTVFSMWSVMRHEPHGAWGQRQTDLQLTTVCKGTLSLSPESCIVSSCYLAASSDDRIIN